MAQTSLILKTVSPYDETISKSITNVNPKASFTALDAFAKKFNSLSKNTYLDAYRVSRESVSEGAYSESAGE